MRKRSLFQKCEVDLTLGEKKINVIQHTLTGKNKRKKNIQSSQQTEKKNLTKLNTH